MEKKPIPVTRPLLPPLEEFIPYLEKIWERHWLTNNGPFHEALESELANYLGTPHLSLFANGTLALVTALQTLRISGEVITTPYSFIATSHALLWNNIHPVFVDIDPVTLNLDPDKVEAAITPHTSAILPVHVYGRPCDTQRLQNIADIYGLRLIYDAAHAFAVEDEGGSITRYGDLSILSFHATKVFNTIEGGAIISPDARTKRRIDYLKNFGFADETTVVAPGINAKMNEVQAAAGLLQLKYIDQALAERAFIDQHYRVCLSDIPGIQPLSPPNWKRHNYAYFPILVCPEYPIDRDTLFQHLRENNILARRYFYPLISNFPMYRNLPSATPDNLPIATQVAERVLCLPIYPGLSSREVEKITTLIRFPLS